MTPEQIVQYEAFVKGFEARHGTTPTTRDVIAIFFELQVLQNPPAQQPVEGEEA